MIPARRRISPAWLTITAVLFWTLAVGGSLFWNMENTRNHFMDMVYAEAKANLNKDITMRRWATSHGGVYVPITDQQQPVPWLKHIPGQNITTTDGRQLTLINPATMLRQMMDRYATDYGVRGRITGLKWLNPANAPDAWERQQLESFARGEAKEVSEVANIDGKPYLRHLRAMFMEPGCIKCHAILGYKTGDLRGATGVNYPLADYYERMAGTQQAQIITHTVIWLLGLLGIIGVGMASQRRAIERQRQEESLRLYASMFEHSGEAIIITDSQNNIVDANPAFTAMTGYTLDEVRGQNPRIMASDKTPPETYQSIWQALNNGQHWQGEIWDRRKGGGVFPKWAVLSTVHDANGKLVNYIALYTDITERKASEARIERLAHFDPLTGLINRYSLESRLQQALLSARRNRNMLAVLFIDMDRFKLINDTLGHSIGDQLLQEVAKRLSERVRESDIVARQGGDEFVVGLTDLEDQSNVIPLVEQLLRALSQPYDVDGHTLRSTPSIGIAIYPNDAPTVAELLKNADLAMYHAKSQGRNNYQFFNADMNLRMQKRVALEEEMRHALENQQFELHYQPQLDLRTGTINGVEALVRWRHPERGMISPMDFIPIAEESGFILPLGHWILTEACQQLSVWQSHGLSNIHMSINLSTRQFSSADLPSELRNILDQACIDPKWLDLEITESMSMESPEQAIKTMRRLTDLGVTLTIDDFGTGYSSLAYLKLFPVHTLKIDRTFVKDIETDQNDADICDTTVLLAHRLGLETVAEGVETAAQFKYLLSIGCERLQGYLISKPLPAAEAEEFIRQSRQVPNLGSIDVWDKS